MFILNSKIPSHHTPKPTILNNKPTKPSKPE